MPKADGYCNWCNEPVPSYMLNKFYCSYGCMQAGWDMYHPKSDDND